jgi:DNA-binding MarR family transcriptional regulator
VKRKVRCFNKITAIAALAFLLCSFFISSSVSAQGSSISGTIQDDYIFEPLEGVLITVKDYPNGPLVNETESEISGDYQIAGLSEGTYNVTFEIPGYKEKFEIIQLDDNETLVLDVILHKYLYDTNGDGINDSDKLYKVGEALGELSIFPLCFSTIILGTIVLIISFVMYSKIKEENLLKNAQRMRIFEYVKENPGKHYRAILKDLDLPMGVLTYHLNRLEKGSYIKSRQDGMMRRFFVSGRKTEVKFFLSEIQESILNVVKENKGISQSKIAEKIGVSRKVVNYHVNILNQAGFLLVESHGRESACYFVGS